MFLVPESDDPQAVEVRRLTVRPGDRLVIRAKNSLTEDEVAGIRRELDRAFAKCDYKPPVLVLDCGLEIGVIGPEADGA